MRGEIPQAEEPDGLWIMDFLDLNSIKSIIHGLEMDLDLQIKTPWILDGFGFTKISMKSMRSMKSMNSGRRY